MSERRKEPRRDSDKLAYYPWYVREFNADPPVQTMSPMEEFCYRRLLDYQWLNGSIPEDPKSLARICKNIPLRQMARAWAVLAPQFPEGRNRRLERERRKVEERIEHAQKAADARWNPVPGPSPPDAQPMPEHMPEASHLKGHNTNSNGSTPHHRARVLARLGESDDLTSVCRTAGNPDALCSEIMAMLEGTPGHSPHTTDEQMRLTLRDLAITGERVTGRMLRKFAEKQVQPESTNGNGKPAYTGYQEYKG